MCEVTKDFFIKNIKRYAHASCIKNDFPELYNNITQNYPNTQFMEALWLYYAGLDENSKPSCPLCGKTLKFDKFTIGYKAFCSKKCAQKGSRKKACQTMIEKYGGVGYGSKEIKGKIENTNLKRYGTIHCMQNAELQEKAKNTNIEKYGVAIPLQSKETMEKFKNTMLKRYGVEHALQSKHFLNKSKQTCKEHFGVEHPSQSEEIKQKTQQTNIKKYGVENPSQNKEIKEKTRQSILKKYGREYGFDYEKIKRTNIKKYGVENPFSNEEVKRRINQTMVEKYGVDNIFKHPEFKHHILDLNKQKYLKTHPDIIDIEYFSDNQPVYTIKCCDSKCQLCGNRCFKLTRNQYYNRTFHNIELCPIKNPLCVSKNTSIEIFIKTILDSHNIEYQSNNRSILKSKELDIYIPSKKLAIECNGCYWHSENEKPKNYHISKMRECNKLGIQLIQIWEDQIIHKPDIVKSLVLSKLGIYDNRIYARKCDIREVPAKECTNFLNSNHLQGSVNGSIRLGLYYNDDLVSIMVFGKKRKPMNGVSIENIYELYRYCNKLNVQVIGGASKLFKYFVKKYNPIQIESFSSNDISNGNLYKLLGFVKEPKISRSYWYINSTMQRIHRFSFRKSELIKQGFDSNLSESKITESMGLLRIYDSGQSKWIWSLT